MGSTLLWRPTVMMEASTRTTEHKVSYKVMLLGDSGVGKTSLARCLKHEQFMPTLISTVGIDFVTKYFYVDGCPVRLQVWDTAGQERFRTITKFHYRGSKGLVMVFDLTDKLSFQQITYWFNTLAEKDLDAEQVILVGNKCDLDDQRQVSHSKAAQFAHNHGIKYFETSCKTGVNVQEMFQQLALDILEANHPHYMNAYNKSLKDHYQAREHEVAGTVAANGSTSNGDVFKLRPPSTDSRSGRWSCCVSIT